MSTREKIIDTAIELFNEKGTKAVTTNHIAAAAGISPGNLYYHFRNKEHIIRAILERLDAKGMVAFQEICIRHEPGTARAFVETINLIQELNWEFIFFKRELSALFINDPSLKLGEQAFDMVKIARAFVDASVARGVIKDLPEDVRHFIADGFCMTNLFWVNYLEIMSMEVTTESMRRGSKHFLDLLKPYLTEQGLAEITKVAEETQGS